MKAPAPPARTVREPWVTISRCTVWTKQNAAANPFTSVRYGDRLFRQILPDPFSSFEVQRGAQLPYGSLKILGGGQALPYSTGIAERPREIKPGRMGCYDQHEGGYWNSSSTISLRPANDTPFPVIKMEDFGSFRIPSRHCLKSVLIFAPCP